MQVLLHNRIHIVSSTLYPHCIHIVPIANNADDRKIVCVAACGHIIILYGNGTECVSDKLLTSYTY